MKRAGHTYWELGPFPVAGADHGWRWRAQGYEVDGDFWPTGVQVAYKWQVCHHEVDPGDLGPMREWEPTPCDCWPDEPAPFGAVPTGGLRSTDLRGVHLSLALEQLRRVADNALRFGLAPQGLEDMLGRVTTRTQPAGPGRPALPAETHLRRLKVLADTYAAGKGQGAAARRLGISEATLRRTLEWAREQGYWTKGHKGERGRLTVLGEAAVEAIKGRRSR